MAWHTGHQAGQTAARAAAAGYSTHTVTKCLQSSKLPLAIIPLKAKPVPYVHVI